MKYLYAASVRGIQSYIFQTNKLREIVGASAMLDKIFSIDNNEKSHLKKFCKRNKINISEIEVITAAAANFRCVTTKPIGEIIFKEFPKYLASKIPGVLFTQVLLPFEENKILDTFLKVHKLLNAQRNKSIINSDPPFMGILKSRRTGGAAVKLHGSEYLDAQSLAKQKYLKKREIPFFEDFTGISPVDKNKLPYLFEDLIKRSTKNDANTNSWIAVLHVDGNNIGKELISILENENAYENLKSFSKSLAICTKKAVRDACKTALKGTENEPFYILRPIILGGDDVTLVIRADKALEFVKEFLESFEKYTKFDSNISKSLTACAGVAFIKYKFPFHYGIDLAEKLTKEAKKASKMINEEHPPSCVSIFKVQSSYVEPLEEMRKRAYGTNMEEYLYRGPYFLRELDDGIGHPLLPNLLEKIEYLQNSAKYDQVQKSLAKLRQYIELLKTHPERAALLLERMKKSNKNFCESLDVEKRPSILYDVISSYNMI